LFSRFVAKGYVAMVAVAGACRAAVLGLAISCVQASATETKARPPVVKPVCLNAAETRETVKARKLFEPFVALKLAAGQGKAEALSARLCQQGDDFIYSVILLRRDGHLMRVEMEAKSGKLILRPSEPTK
jgi:hypothetical protein